VPSLQIALALAASVYFLKEQKKTSLGLAIALAIASVSVAGILGGFLESFLRVDLVPLGPLHSPATLVGELCLAGAAAATLLLA